MKQLKIKSITINQFTSSDKKAASKLEVEIIRMSWINK